MLKFLFFLLTITNITLIAKNKTLSAELNIGFVTSISVLSDSSVNFTSSMGNTYSMEVCIKTFSSKSRVTSIAECTRNSMILSLLQRSYIEKLPIQVALVNNNVVALTLSPLPSFESGK